MWRGWGARRMEEVLRVLRLYALLWLAPRYVARDFPRGGGLALWLGPLLLGLGFAWCTITLYSLLAQVLPILYKQLFALLPALRHYGIAENVREPVDTLALIVLEFMLSFYLFVFCYSRLVGWAGGSLSGVDGQRAMLWALWLQVPPLLLGGGTVYLGLLSPLLQGVDPGASGSVLGLFVLSLVGLSWSSLVGCILIAERSGIGLGKTLVLMMVGSLAVALLMWPLRFWQWS